MRRKLTIQPKPAPPPATFPDTETLANAIIKLGDAVRKLDKSGMNKRAIIILLHHTTNMSQKNIALILDAIPKLQKTFCK